MLNKRYERYITTYNQWNKTSLLIYDEFFCYMTRNQG